MSSSSLSSDDSYCGAGGGFRVADPLGTSPVNRGEKRGNLLFNT